MTVVFFDLVGTLIRPRRPIGVQYSEVAKRYGAELDARTVEAAFHQAMRTTAGSTPGAGSLELTQAAERQWWAELVKDVVASCGPGVLQRPDVFEDYFAELYEHFTTANAWRLYDDSIAALDALAARGIATGLITNYDTRVHRVLDALDLASRLDTVTIPATAGVSKPDPRIFLHALGSAGVSAAEAVHVGDSLGDDYHGSLAAGMSALLLDRDGRHAGAAGVSRIETLTDLSRLI